ncbi:type VI secretion system baseplate subunit TssG [Noviherbaspirillum agri]
MPAQKRRLDPGLIQRLQEEPYRFEFFQAVRTLLAHHRKHTESQPSDVLGRTIRFRNSVSLSFPASEIESLDIEWAKGDVEEHAAIVPGTGEGATAAFSGVTLVPAFMGLTGPSGVLPRHYTQHVAEREMYHRDGATRAFLDIFTSRAVALFYRSWLKYRPHFQYEADRKNGFLPMVLDLAGLGLRGASERLVKNGKGVAEESLAYYASALRSRPQSVAWFSHVVSDYFGVPCVAEQFVGQWFELPKHERSYLGNANCTLGQTSLCGGRVWDRQSKVRLVIGPVRRPQFDDFLPGGDAFHGLGRFFRLMVGVTFDCEVQLILDRRDIAPARLDSRSNATGLGWNAWFRPADSPVDSRDTTFLIKATDQTD